MMVDIKDYNTKKAKGLASVISSDPEGNGNKAFVVKYVKYDPIKALEGTIERIPDEIAYVTKKELEENRDSLQAEIDAINAFIAEAEESE